MGLDDKVMVEADICGEAETTSQAYAQWLLAATGGKPFLCEAMQEQALRPFLEIQAEVGALTASWQPDQNRLYALGRRTKFGGEDSEQIVSLDRKSLLDRGPVLIFVPGFGPMTAAMGDPFLKRVAKGIPPQWRERIEVATLGYIHDEPFAKYPTISPESVAVGSTLESIQYTLAMIMRSLSEVLNYYRNQDRAVFIAGASFGGIAAGCALAHQGIDSLLGEKDHFFVALAGDIHRTLQSNQAGITAMADNNIKDHVAELLAEYRDAFPAQRFAAVSDNRIAVAASSSDLASPGQWEIWQNTAATQVRLEGAHSRIAGAAAQSIQEALVYWLDMFGISSETALLR